MNQAVEGSAYRDFRKAAYRKKYEKALNFGGKSISFGALLDRIECAYNTFCQTGVEKEERVCLWLPDCPDLPACFYGLSRLGATALLCHPAQSAREIKNIMEVMGAKRMVTTPDRYGRFLQEYGPIPEGYLMLSCPEKDLRGAAKKAYLANAGKPFGEEVLYLHKIFPKNRYSSNEPPAVFGQKEEVILFGTDCFLQCNPLIYSGEELSNGVPEFWRHKETVRSVYLGIRFASEGGFLAVHSALCAGKEVVWSVGDPINFLKKMHPDYLVAYEEFFWLLRQKADVFQGRWKNLQGGYQFGKDLSSLMKKYGQKAFWRMGGKGELSAFPMPLKVRGEDLYFMEDFGLRLSDMEQDLSNFSGVSFCRCIGRDEGILLQLSLKEGGSGLEIGRRISAYCREKMNAYHKPFKLDFNIKSI